MARPRSIVIFEICFLIGLAASLAGPLLVWPALTASVAEQAHVGADAAGVVNGVPVAVLLLAAAVGLLLWWLVARRGSVIARWVVAALLAYNIVSSAYGLIGMAGLLDLARLIVLLALVVDAIALVMLFRPDASAWFAAAPEELP